MTPGSIEDFLPFSTNGVAIASDGSVWQYYPLSPTGLAEVEAPITPQPPVNVALPQIQIPTDLVVGSQLVMTTGQWTGLTPITYSYSWRRGATPIPGAVQLFYTLQAADIGLMISGAATATNGDGFATAVSAAVGPILDVPPLDEPTQQPTLRAAPPPLVRSHHAKPPHRR
jgi:hypothetical protein